MKPTLEEAARRLADRHVRIEPSLRRVFFYPDPSGEDVRLLEVVDGSLEADEVYPFRFAANPRHDLPFPTVLIELSPAEFKRLGQGNLRLPSGWQQPVILYGGERE